MNELHIICQKLKPSDKQKTYKKENKRFQDNLCLVKKIIIIWNRNGVYSFEMFFWKTDLWFMIFG